MKKTGKITAKQMANVEVDVPVAHSCEFLFAALLQSLSSLGKRIKSDISLFFFLFFFF